MKPLLPRARLGLLAPPLLLAACGGSGGSSGGSGGLSAEAFIVRSTRQAVAGSATVRASGRRLAYVVDEATTGQGSLNSDGDSSDGVVHVVDMQTRVETNTGIAARELAWVGEELYLVVDEALDGVDWDGDGGTGGGELALVHWSPTAGSAFLACLDGAPTPAIAAIGLRLFFAESLGAAPGVGATSLRVIDAAAPRAVGSLGTTWTGASGLRPRVLGADEGLLFLALDEALDGVLNADGDTTDHTVLGLLDGTFSNGLVRNTGLALKDAAGPRRALATGTGDWLVAFLVSEQAHVPSGGGFTGFNDPAKFAPSWRPLQCTGTPDTDTSDQVLFYLHFAAWAADPFASPPRNTGLVGVDRVLVVDGYVGTISREQNEDCDLNDDGQILDRVFRWTAAVPGLDPILPPFHPDHHLVALADPADVPGGTYGVAELAGRFVALVSEQRDATDHDGDPSRNVDLLAWIDPAIGGTWRYDHGTTSPFYGGATWMAETPGHSRLLVAAPESVFRVNVNGLSGPDTDLDDSVPSFNRFEGGRLVFDVVRVAVDRDDAGLVFLGSVVLYRVSEAEDDRDWTGDGQENDFALFRTSPQGSVYMAPLNHVPERPAVDAEVTSAAPFGAAFVADEAMAGSDYDGDGNQNDFVVRYFHL